MLKDMERVLIRNIKQGTQKCIDQVKDIIGDKGLQDLETLLGSNVRRIEQQIDLTSQQKNRFSRFGTSQLLKAELSTDCDLVERPPSIEVASQLTSKLRQNVNYEEAILQQNFSIEQ